MSPELMVQVLVIGFSVVALGWNVSILIKRMWDHPLQSRLAQDRPLTRESIKYITWITLATTFKLADNTFSALVRNFYTLPVLTDEGPRWVLLTVLQNYWVDYFVSCLPALFLLLLLNSLKEYDVKVATDARLQARKKILGSQQDRLGRRGV